GGSDGGGLQHGDLGVFVHRDLGKLAVVPLEHQGGLPAEGGLAPHLDAADRAEPFVHDDAFDLGLPATVPHARVLDDADLGSGSVLWLLSGNHDRPFTRRDVLAGPWARRRNQRMEPAPREAGRTRDVETVFPGLILRR